MTLIRFLQDTYYPQRGPVAGLLQSILHILA